MANPQTEDGYTRIANSIIEALARIRVSGTEWQILCVIFRKTYGFQKIKDQISMGQFSNLTGIKRPNISKAIDKLVEKNMIVIKKDNRTNMYSFNKDFDKWKPLSKKITPVKVVIKKHNKVVIKKDNTGVIKKHNDVLSKKIHTKEKKETITKESKEMYIYSEIFDFWNSQKIIVHSSVEKLKPCIEAKLKIFSLEEIKEAIGNYSEISKGDKYFFSYKWTLKEFFQRDTGFEKFLSRNKPHENYLEKSSPKEFKSPYKEFKAPSRTPERPKVEQKGNPVMVGRHWEMYGDPRAENYQEQRVAHAEGMPIPASVFKEKEEKLEEKRPSSPVEGFQTMGNVLSRTESGTGEKTFTAREKQKTETEKEETIQQRKRKLQLQFQQQREKRKSEKC